MFIQRKKYPVPVSRRKWEILRHPESVAEKLLKCCHLWRLIGHTRPFLFCKEGKKFKGMQSQASEICNLGLTSLSAVTQMRFPPILITSFSSPLILWCLNMFWKELHIYHEPLTELLWASTSSSQSLPLCKYNVKCASAQLFRETLF